MKKNTLKKFSWPRSKNWQTIPNIFLVIFVLINFSKVQTMSQVKIDEKVNYAGWPNCIKLSNNEIELIVTTDVGPRVIRCGFKGGQNLFKEVKEDLGKVGGTEWRSYGGHRLWHAPEAMPRTYSPDNSKVQYKISESSVILSQAIEPETGIVKEIEILMDPSKPHVTLRHRLTNKSLWPIELSAWCLTVMAPGGKAIFPQEDYRPHPDYLLPARPMVLWHYTDLSDPRYKFSPKYIILKQDPAISKKQKFGILNKQGWCAYVLGNDVFVKKFDYDPSASYPDYGCNNETFVNADMLEVETLGPLVKLEPGSTTEHIEHWYIFKSEIADSDQSIDQNLVSKIKTQ
jgi:hypothetical protein